MHPAATRCDCPYCLATATRQDSYHDEQAQYLVDNLWQLMTAAAVVLVQSVMLQLVDVVLDIGPARRRPLLAGAPLIAAFAGGSQSHLCC